MNLGENIDKRSAFWQKVHIALAELCTTKLYQVSGNIIIERFSQFCSTKLLKMGVCGEFTLKCVDNRIFYGIFAKYNDSLFL